jgi:hypothetical protein
MFFRRFPFDIVFVIIAMGEVESLEFVAGRHRVLGCRYHRQYLDKGKMPSMNGRSGALGGADVLHPGGAEHESTPTLDPRVTWLTAAGALAAAGLLRAARGYRSFPSIDDFPYLPMALARLDPQLYPRDVLLRETPLHMPILSPLVAILQATTGLALGFWLITVVLSLLTVFAMYRWMRALGLPGALLPLAAVVTCAGRLQGLGRGEYDGIFGNAFHFQWAALCALL